MKLRGGLYGCGLALAALLSAFGSSAHASAGATTVDKTFSCTVKLGGSHPYLDVAGGAKVDANPGYSLVYTALKKQGPKFVAQLSFNSASKGLQVDATLCKHSSRRVPLRSSKLKSGQTVSSSFVGYFSDRCVTARRASVRVRLREGGSGPAHARVAVVSDNRKRAPLAEEIWTPTRIRYFVARGCVDRGSEAGP